jgi:hypothetical protein
MNTLPDTTELETAILHMALRMNGLAALTDIKAEHFHDPQNAALWDELQAMLATGSEVTPPTVFRRLRDSAKLDAIGGGERFRQIYLANPLAVQMRLFGAALRQTTVQHSPSVVEVLTTLGGDAAKSVVHSQLMASGLGKHKASDLIKAAERNGHITTFAKPRALKKPEQWLKLSDVPSAGTMGEE